VVLTSSRDAADYRSLLERSGARGFIRKAEICGASSVDAKTLQVVEVAGAPCSTLHRD
jgi:hypothetical protein